MAVFPTLRRDPGHPEGQEARGAGTCGVRSGAHPSLHRASLCACLRSLQDPPSPCTNSSCPAAPSALGRHQHHEQTTGTAVAGRVQRGLQSPRPGFPGQRATDALQSNRRGGGSLASGQHADSRALGPGQRGQGTRHPQAWWTPASPLSPA